MQEGEIFSRVSNWLSKVTPSAIHPALFDCNVCMTPYYGSILYVIIYGINWQWPVVVIVAMGINAALNKLSPEKDSEEEEKTYDFTAKWVEPEE